MMQTKLFSPQSNFALTIFGLTLLSLCLFASPSLAQIPTAIHARWDSDLTDTTPSACATSGIVANPSFHFVAAYQYPITSVTMDWARIEEPEQHVPPQPEIQGGTLTLTGPPPCGSLLVENPTQWMWGISGQLTNPVKLHNAAYRVVVQYRYEVMDGPPYTGSRHTEGPFQTCITVDVQNLGVTSTDERKVLRWDPARPEDSDTSFFYTISCAQQQWYQVTIRIFSTAGELVYEQTESRLRGSSQFLWNGTRNVGGSGPAARGLYTFDVLVRGATPYETDALRCAQLEVSQRNAWIVGYDRGSEQHTLQAAYVLTDSGNPIRNASQANVRLYGPDLAPVEAEVTDGVVTNPPNAQNPVWNTTDPFQRRIETPGDYTYIFAARDSRATRYKNHQEKWALQRNYIQIFPLAVNYDFQNYPNPPPAGTTPYARTAANYQRILADRTAYASRSYTNNTAQQALEQLRQAAVFFVFGHGGERLGGEFKYYQTFWNGAWSVMVQTTYARNRLVGLGQITADRSAG